MLIGDIVMAQGVALDANCDPLQTYQQQRLYAKANEGPDALRQFVFIRRAILQVDVYEIARWADALNGSRAVCMKKASDSRARAQVGDS